MSDEIKISEWVKLKRADRPDEWSMDEIARRISLLEATSEAREKLAKFGALVFNANKEYSAADHLRIDDLLVDAEILVVINGVMQEAQGIKEAVEELLK